MSSDCLQCVWAVLRMSPLKQGLDWSPVRVKLWWTKWHWDICFYQEFLFSPVSTIPPLLHTHPSIYHPHCIMFLSQHFSFPLSVTFHHCSTLNLNISGYLSRCSDSLSAGRSGDRILTLGETLRARPCRPCVAPSLLYDGNCVSVPGVNRPGRGVDQPPCLVPRLKKE
jgi:hypothetical protein